MTMALIRGGGVDHPVDHLFFGGLLGDHVPRPSVLGPCPERPVL